MDSLRRSGGVNDATHARSHGGYDDCLTIGRKAQVPRGGGMIDIADFLLIYLLNWTHCLSVDQPLISITLRSARWIVPMTRA